MGSESEKKPYVLTAAQRRYLVMKRGWDILLSVLFLPVMAVPMLLVMLIQKLAEPSQPVFFRQERVGKDGALFTLVKFRTMGSGAPRGAAAAVGKGAGGTMTPLGRFLRASSIDELPQLWQVLTGKMSLVGPRPLIPQETVVHDLRRAWGVYQLRPGITGWAQVNGRDLVSDEEKAALDLAYLKKLSFGMDCRILLVTVGKVIGREGVRERDPRQF